MAELAVTAYMGNLLVVGGRAVRMSPPGALAESAPKRTNRAREGDTFFILLTPDERSHTSAAVFETLAQLAADTYFGSSGGITGGLREALTAINAQLITQGDGVQINGVALVLRGNELYAARSGRAFSVLLQWPRLIAFPTERHDPLAINLPALGADPTPDIQLARYTVAPGQALLLADPGLNARTDDELRMVLSAENVGAMLDKVKALAGEQTTASVIRFMAHDIADSTGSLPQPATRGAARISQPRATGPTAPSLSTPLPDFPTESETASLSTMSDTDDDMVFDPGVSAVVFTAPAANTAAPDTSALDATAPSAPTSPFAPEDIAALQAALHEIEGDTDATDAENTGEQAKSGVGSRLARRRHTSADAPEDTPTRRSGPSPLHKTTVTVRRTVRDVLRGTLAGLLAITSAITGIIDRLVPAPDENGKQGIPTNVAIGVAILIPFVIVIVVVGLALSEQGKGEFQVYLDRAKTAHQEALAMSGTSCENPAHRLLWIEVLRLAELASEYRPNDQDVLIISADARNYLDCFDKVERRDLRLLHEFASDAELVGPIVNSADLYTLDRYNGRVYHDTLTETGDNLITRSDTPIIYTGQVISNASGNFVVGDLIDIEWLTSGGTAYDNVLIALDHQGQLIAYSPTFFTSAQQLVTEGRWVNPVALGVFRSNIYILDSGADQIWRYVPPSGARAYSNAPEEYFNGDAPPDLANAVDFGISEEGAVYVLFNDGTVKKYLRNSLEVVEEQPFEFRESPDNVLESGVALFIDNDPLSRQLYIVDPATSAIYETLWGGKFRRGYRPGNLPNAFDDVSGIYADEVDRNNMYVLSGNKLYQFERN